MAYLRCIFLGAPTLHFDGRFFVQYSKTPVVTDIEMRSSKPGNAPKFKNASNRNWDEAIKSQNQAIDQYLTKTLVTEIEMKSSKPDNVADHLIEHE